MPKLLSDHSASSGAAMQGSLARRTSCTWMGTLMACRKLHTVPAVKMMPCTTRNQSGQLEVSNLYMSGPRLSAMSEQIKARQADPQMYS